VSKIRSDLKESNVCIKLFTLKWYSEFIKQRTRSVTIIFKKHGGQPEQLN